MLISNSTAFCSEKRLNASAAVIRLWPSPPRLVCQACAIELGNHGIRCNAIAPGLFNSEITQVWHSTFALSSICQFPFSESVVDPFAVMRNCDQILRFDFEICMVCMICMICKICMVCMVCMVCMGCMTAYTHFCGSESCIRCASP